MQQKIRQQQLPLSKLTEQTAERVLTGSSGENADQQEHFKQSKETRADMSDTRRTCNRTSECTDRRICITDREYTAIYYQSDRCQ